MNGEDNNSLRFETIEDFDNEYLPPDAKPLCPCCLKPCDPLQYYCTNCGSNEPINPLASYMPYLRLRFTTGMFGKLYRLARNCKMPAALRIVFWFVLIFWLASLAF